MKIWNTCYGFYVSVPRHMLHEPFTMIQFPCYRYVSQLNRNIPLFSLNWNHVVSTVLLSIVPNVHCQLSRQACWKPEANTQGGILWGPQNRPQVHIEGGQALVEVTMGQNARPQPTISNKITGKMLGYKVLFYNWLLLDVLLWAFWLP